MPYQDSHGTIRLNGIFCEVSFSGVYSGAGADGLWLQIGGTPVPRPRLTAAFAPDAIELSFTAETGIQYQIEESQLPGGIYAAVGAVIAGDGEIHRRTQPRAAGNRFFRIRVLVCQ